MSGEPTIHRFPAKHEGAFVNTDLVETEAGVVAVDALLTICRSESIDGRKEAHSWARETDFRPALRAGSR